MTQRTENRDPTYKWLLFFKEDSKTDRKEVIKM